MKDNPCLCGKINIVKIPILLNAIYRFNTISIKFPMAFSTEIEKKESKVFIKPQTTPNRQSNPLLGKNKDGSIIVPGFKLHYKAILTKVIWHWNKTIHID